MTDEKDVQIDEMPAGPELDGLIDEKIFGHKVLGTASVVSDPDSFHRFMIPYDYYADGEGAIQRPVYFRDCMCEIRDENDIDYFGHTSSCLESSRPYSEVTHIAWQIVDHLLAHDYQFKLEHVGAPEWMCSFGVMALARTPELAICRAALKVKKEGDSD